MDLGQMMRIWPAQCRGCTRVWGRVHARSAWFCDVTRGRAKIWWSRGIIGICLRYPALSNTHLTQESPPCFIILSLSDYLTFAHTNTHTHTDTHTHTHSLIQSVIVNPAVCWDKNVLYMANNHVTRVLMSYLSVFWVLMLSLPLFGDT